MRVRARRQLTPFGFWVSAVLVSVVVAVVGAGIALVIVRTEPARYQSTATLSIDQPFELATSTDPGEFAKLTALRYKYADLVGTLSFADDASQGTNIAAGTFHADVDATVPTGSLLFQVSGQAGDPRLAQSVAANAANALVRYVGNEQDQLGIRQKQRLQLKVVTPAQRAGQIAPSTNREAGASGFVAVVLFVLALSLQALRRRFS